MIKILNGLATLTFPKLNCQDVSTSPCGNPKEEEDGKEVFISIQAFPALLDITPSCEIKRVSCGSRHTAAVTSKMSLFAVDVY